jgi:hypothetical protein
MMTAEEEGIVERTRGYHDGGGGCGSGGGAGCDDPGQREEHLDAGGGRNVTATTQRLPADRELSESTPVAPAHGRTRRRSWRMRSAMHDDEVDGAHFNGEIGEIGDDLAMVVRDDDDDDDGWVCDVFLNESVTDS